MRAALVIMFVLTVVALFVMGDERPDTASNTLVDLKTDACYASRWCMKPLLKSSEPVDFGLCSEESVSIDDQGRYVVNSYVVTQNALGRKLRRPYSVVLVYIPKENSWELVEVMRTP